MYIFFILTHKLYWLREGILIYEMVHGNTPFWDENNLNIYRRILTGKTTGRTMITVSLCLGDWVLFRTTGVAANCEGC